MKYPGKGSNKTPMSFSMNSSHWGKIRKANQIGGLSGKRVNKIQRQELNETNPHKPKGARGNARSIENQAIKFQRATRTKSELDLGKGVKKNPKRYFRYAQRAQLKVVCGRSLRESE